LPGESPGNPSRIELDVLIRMWSSLSDLFGNEFKFAIFLLCCFE